MKDLEISNPLTNTFKVSNAFFFFTKYLTYVQVRTTDRTSTDNSLRSANAGYINDLQLIIIP